MKTPNIIFTIALTVISLEFLIVLVSLPNHAIAQNIGINTTGATPNASALLDIDAAPGNSKGLLIPRLTTAQMNAIASPATGLIIYNTDCNSINYYNGAAWVALGNTGSVSTPGAITGSTTPCQNATGIAYSITAVSGATGYNWTVPTGASVATGQGTTSVTVDFATSNGNACVTASNACGTSNASCTAITLQSAPAAPTATAASNIAQTSFDANWNASSGATTYYLDVATDAGFTSLVTGYNNLNVGNVTTYGVTGLTCATAYYYRVRAENSCGTSVNSNTITVTTVTCCPSFSDDFLSYSDQASADAVWVTTDIAKYRVNITNDNLDFDARSDQTDNRIAYDLGFTVSNTAWILRFKMTISTHVQGAEPQHLSWSIGIVANNVDAATNTDYIGLAHASNNSVSYYKPISGDALNFDGMGVEPDFTLAPGVYTKWVKIIRTSATTYDVSFYDDANYTVLNETRTGTCAATITGLRYIMMTSEYANQVIGTADWRGTIDDIQFCDGVTSF